MEGVGITYRVVGRYMDGQKLTGYHLVGSDGSQLPINKERAIFMITKGIIENMRIQSDTSSDKSSIIVRGKGVNLQKLPVYDEKKQTFRGDANSQAVANSAVKPKKDSGINPMGQLRIVARIMKGTNCIGYMVEDNSGARRCQSRESILQLGIQKLISNAEVQKGNINAKTGKPDFILRGKGMAIKDLPILIINDDGKIIDPNKKESGTSFRLMRVKRSGLVANKVTSEKIPFQAGNYLVCGVKGNITVEDMQTVVSKYTVDNEANSALCDDYLDNVSDYSIEFFGQAPIVLNKNIVLKWGIIKAK